MRFVRATVLWLLATLVLPSVVLAQGEIRIELAPDTPFPAAPQFDARAINFDPSTAPHRIRVRTAAHVELTVLDLRGRLVKTMMPGVLPSQLPDGRYGRLRDLTSSGCDPTLAWDGSADNRRVVPSGVYLLRFRADGEGESMKKILFLGR